MKRFEKNLSENIADEEIDPEKWKKCHLPDLWDTIGFPEEFKPSYVAVLQRCLFGLIKDGDDLNQMINVASQLEVEDFNNIFPFKSDSDCQDRRVTKLAIVLDAIRTDAAEGLLKTAMAAAQPKVARHKNQSMCRNSVYSPQSCCRMARSSYTSPCL